MAFGQFLNLYWIPDQVRDDKEAQCHPGLDPGSSLKNEISPWLPILILTSHFP